MHPGSWDVIVGRDEVLERLRHAVAEERSVLIVGPPGSGRTRLLAAVTADATPDFTVLPLVARRSGRRIPFSALASFVDAERDASTAGVLARVRGYAAGQQGRRPLLVAVDDADFLDPHSAVVLDHLVRDRDVVVVATVRDGVPDRDTVRRWWKEVGAERVDIGPLTRRP